MIYWVKGIFCTEYIVIYWVTVIVMYLVYCNIQGDKQTGVLCFYSSLNVLDSPRNEDSSLIGRSRVFSGTKVLLYYDISESN